jgi:hypothetical protein
VLLQPESKTTTHVHLQWESSKRSVPKVWNIKLHMPTGANTGASEANTTTVAREANTVAREANTTTVARTVPRTGTGTDTGHTFPAGTGAPWHDLQRHMPS